jgi:hypothetical protein
MRYRAVDPNRATCRPLRVIADAASMVNLNCILAATTASTLP